MRLLTLTNNPLDNRAHEIFISQLESRASVLGLPAVQAGPTEGNLINDLVLKLTLVQTTGDQTQVSVSLPAVQSLANETLSELATQIQVLLATALTDKGFAADAVVLVSTSDGLVFQVNDTSIASLRVRGGFALGFADDQGVGPNVEFTSNAAPVITPIPNQAGATALSFDGDDRVEVLDSTAFTFAGSSTVLIRFKLNTMSGGWNPLVHRSSGTGYGSRAYSFWVNQSTGELFLSTQDATNDQFWYLSAGTVEAGRWYEFASVIDRATGIVRAYLDGVEVLNESIRTTPAISTNVPLIFGGRRSGGIGFNGVIDEIAVWEAARSIIQINADFASGIDDTDADLAGHWKFTVSPIAEDSSSNNQDLVIFGATSVIGPVRVDVSDAPGDPMFLEVFSDTPDVNVTVQDNRYVLIDPETGFSGTARITLVAHDGAGAPGDFRGRQHQVRFDFTSGGNSANAIYGTKWIDADGDGVFDSDELPLDGVKLFLDLDTDGIFDEDEPFTFTDANGDYAFRGLPFIEPVALGPAVLVGDSDVTPDGGATLSVETVKEPSEIVTTTQARFDFIARLDDSDSQPLRGGFTLTARQTVDNSALGDLLKDLTSLLASQFDNLILVDLDSDSKTFSFVTNSFAFMDVRASFTSTVTEITRLADGSTHVQPISQVTVEGALGFAGLTVGVPDARGRVVAKAESVTQPDGRVRETRVDD